MTHHKSRVIPERFLRFIKGFALARLRIAQKTIPESMLNARMDSGTIFFRRAMRGAKKIVRNDRTCFSYAAPA